MRFWLSLVAVREIDQLAELARFAEELGFHGLMVGDHLVWPNRIESRYPYTPDGKIFVPPDTPWPDPWALFAHLAAVTSKLHFASNIYLAALRDPFTVAKCVATASVLSGGRVACGVSAGWLKEEYDIAGIDFARRGARLDEVIEVCRKLWTGAPVEHTGDRFRFGAIMQPAPEQSVPIWIGGGAPAAIRRAARNDGWLPLPMTVAQALAARSHLAEIRAQGGLGMEGYTIGLPLAEPVTAASVRSLEEHGQHDLVVIAPWLPSPWDTEAWLEPGQDPSNLAVKKNVLEKYAGKVLAAVR
jgi:probable F420-dependent oxidoreductase